MMLVIPAALLASVCLVSGLQPPQPAVNLSLGALTVREAVKALATSFGQSLYCEDAIADRVVVLEFKQVTLNSAMKILADTNDLEWSSKGATVRLGLKRVPAPATVWDLPLAMHQVLPAQWREFLAADEHNLKPHELALYSDHPFVLANRLAREAQSRLEAARAPYELLMRKALASSVPKGSTTLGKSLPADTKALVQRVMFLRTLSNREVIEHARNLIVPHLRDPNTITVTLENQSLHIGSVVPGGSSGGAFTGISAPFRPK